MYLATHRHALVKGRENQFEFTWQPFASADSSTPISLYDGGLAQSFTKGGYIKSGVIITQASTFAQIVIETGVRNPPAAVDSAFDTRLMLDIVPGTYEFNLTGQLEGGGADRTLGIGWNQYALDNTNASYPNRLTGPTVQIYNLELEPPGPTFNPSARTINTTVTATLTTGDTRFYLYCNSVFSLTGIIRVKGRRIAS